MSESSFQIYIWPIITLLIGAFITMSAVYIQTRTQKHIQRISFSQRIIENRIEAINEIVRLLNQMITSTVGEKDLNKLYADLLRASTAMADKYHLLPRDLSNKVDKIVDLLIECRKQLDDKKNEFFAIIGTEVKKLRQVIGDYIESHLS